MCIKSTMSKVVKIMSMQCTPCAIPALKYDRECIAKI